MTEHQETVESVEQFVREILRDAAEWPKQQPRWFRGEPDSGKPLLPTLYREGLGGSENQLLQMFRARARAFAQEPVPDRERTDEWLFLARHVGLPTRVLDWSESALVGLYFALKSEAPIVWMLNPLQLNYYAMSPQGESPESLREFPLPWAAAPPGFVNPAFENARGAWEQDGPGVPLPVAVYPTLVHTRLRAQRACFTIHGKRKEPLNGLAPTTILRRYQVEPSAVSSLRDELAVLGVTESVPYPDLDGLARELKNRFV